MHAPLPASVLAHASVELEHPIAVGTAQAHFSISDPGTVTATEAPTPGFF